MPIFPAQNPASLASALDILRSGGVIGIPTETVYGLVVDATNPQAVAQLYALKHRESSKACQILVRNVEAAEQLAQFTPASHALAERFWPGALTLVLPRKPDAPLAPATSAGTTTAGLRCPAHATCQQLLAALPFPLAASSANPAGAEPPLSAQQLHGYFPELGVILDAGTCTIGQASTVVDATGETLTLLRQGALDFAEIERAL